MQNLSLNRIIDFLEVYKYLIFVKYLTNVECMISGLSVKPKSNMIPHNLFYMGS